MVGGCRYGTLFARPGWPTLANKVLVKTAGLYVQIRGYGFPNLHVKRSRNGKNQAGGTRFAGGELVFSKVIRDGFPPSKSKYRSR